MALINKQFKPLHKKSEHEDHGNDLASYPTNQYLVGPTPEEKQLIKDKYREQLEMIKNQTNHDFKLEITNSNS